MESLASPEQQSAPLQTVQVHEKIISPQQHLQPESLQVNTQPNHQIITSESESIKKPSQKQLIHESQKPQDKLANNNSAVEEEVRKLISKMKIQIAEEEIYSYVNNAQGKSTKQIEEWVAEHKVHEQKIEGEKKVEQDTGHHQQAEVKKEEQPIHEESAKDVVEPSDQEIAETFFKEYHGQSNSTITSTHLRAINSYTQIQASIQHLKLYFQSLNGGPANLQSFLQYFRFALQEELIHLTSKIKEQFAFSEEIEEIKQILEMEKLFQQKSKIDFNLQMGEPPFKSSLKFHFALKANQEKNNFNFRSAFVVEFKTRKKEQLKTLLKNELKSYEKLSTLNDYQFFKFFKIEFQVTEKSLKIIFLSLLFDEMLIQIIEKIQELIKQKEDILLRIEGDFLTRNWLVSNEGEKRMLDFLCEGFSASLKGEGSEKTIKHVSSKIGGIIPLFKCVKSGEVKIKAKSPSQTDAFLKRLGISDIAQQLPTTHTILFDLLRHFHSNHNEPNSTQEPTIQTFLDLPNTILLKSLQYLSQHQNQKVSVSLSARITDHLSISVAFLGQIPTNMLK